MSFQLPPNTTASGGGAVNTGGGFTFDFNSSNNINKNMTGQALNPSGTVFGTTGSSNAGNPPLLLGLTKSNATTTVTIPATTIKAALPLNTTTTATVAPTFNSGGATVGSAINFRSASATTASSSTGLSFGQTMATVGAISTATNTNAPTNSGFSFAAPAMTTTTGGQAAITTSTSTAPILSAALAAPSASTSTATTTRRNGFTSLSTATKTTDSSAINSTIQLSYSQLEDYINKWTLTLEEQERSFIDQATQINAWDRILMGNNQKMFELNDAVQQVKSDQQQLDQELEFISAQHKELEDGIAPLQRGLTKMPPIDLERLRPYLMVENLDAQIKQMADDLKELIDNLNENTKCQESMDPIIQIGKILNAHMNSLQWVERSTNTIGSKLNEITKMHMNCKRNAELSFRAAYDD